MGGRASRSKGAGAEREIVQILKARGHEVRRAAYSGALAHEKGDVVGLDGLHMEVKRCEKLQIPAWTRQAESQAKPDEIPAVIYRSSRERWRILVPLEDFLGVWEKAMLWEASQ